MRVQVSGGAFYIVDAFLVYRINDAARFRQAVSGSVDQAEQRLRNRFDAAVRRVYGLRNFESALSEERAQMMVEVRDQIRPDATQLGIDLVDVRIRRTDLTDDVSQQTFARMRAERLAEAERVRARAGCRRVRSGAATDRSVSETVAGARRDAEVLQGEGEAERSSIFANAYQRDPEFFQFYRAMQAYRTALENGGTTMLLRPDSEFFRYFDNAGDPALRRAAHRPRAFRAPGPAAPALRPPHRPLPRPHRLPRRRQPRPPLRRPPHRPTDRSDLESPPRPRGGLLDSNAFIGLPLSSGPPPHAPAEEDPGCFAPTHASPLRSPERRSRFWPSARVPARRKG